VESEKRWVSKVLVISDPSSQALMSVCDVLQTLRKDQLLFIRIIISFLSETLKWNLGPNILGALTRQETETLAKAKELFDRISTPYDLKLIVVPPWNTVLDDIDDIRDVNHDLIMLQGEFLDFWKQYATRGCPYREMMESQKYSILTIN